MLKETLRKDILNYIGNSNLKEQLGIEGGFQLSFLAQGEYNINYIIENRGKRWVFRVNTDSQLGIDNQIEYEYRAIKLLEDSGMTPRGLYLDGSKEQLAYGVLVMEYLEGRPLEYGSDLEIAGSIFGKIHSLDTELAKEELIVERSPLSDRIVEGEKWLSSYMNSPRSDKTIRQLLERLLDKAKAEVYREEYFKREPWMVINNTEVNSHNFIIGGERNYLIDWEKPVVSDPCQDITQFLAETTTLWKQNYLLSKEERATFFSSYKSSLGIVDRDIEERVEIYKPYLYLRALSWCASAWIEYQRPGKAIVNMDTFKKIDSYLQEDFISKLLRPYI